MFTIRQQTQQDPFCVQNVACLCFIGHWSCGLTFQIINNLLADFRNRSAIPHYLHHRVSCEGQGSWSVALHVTGSATEPRWRKFSVKFLVSCNFRFKKI